MNNLSERLKQLKFKVIDGYRANFKLDEPQEKALEEYYGRLK